MDAKPCNKASKTQEKKSKKSTKPLELFNVNHDNENEQLQEHSKKEAKTVSQNNKISPQ